METEDTALPSELAAEESRYLRRHGAVRRKRFPTRARRIALAAASLLVLSAAGYCLVTFAVQSPHFVLSSANDISVEGNQYVTREEVLNALALPLTGPARDTTFCLPLAEKARQVEAIPWVKAVTLRRTYPRRLTVQISERVPVALVNLAGQLKVIDAEGVLLEKPEGVFFDFPVLTGLGTVASASERKRRIALYSDFHSQLAGEAGGSGWLISEVNLADGDDLKALLVRGSETFQLHFGDRDFLQRFRNFLALLPEVRNSNVRIDSVDLRYRNQIVVSPRAVPAEGMNRTP